MTIFDKYTRRELYDMYDEMLDDIYMHVDICGHKYAASVALKEVDPIAYDVGFDDFCDMLEQE
jgi:hypothetical protein